MTKDELYAKWPVLQSIELPEWSTCCWGCAASAVADVAGWPAAADWENVMFDRFHSPRDFVA